MNYTLGLDIGIASIGWAVLKNNEQGLPCKIEDLGVRIFEAAEHPKTGASEYLRCGRLVLMNQLLRSFFLSHFLKRGICP